MISFNPFGEIANSSDEMLAEQFAHLRNQILLMYALILINAAFLAFATWGDVPAAYGVVMPLGLLAAIAVRAFVWFLRKDTTPSPQRIRRYLYGTIAAAAFLSLAFGGWGLLLFNKAGPAYGAAIALYIFVGSISCCYCLQALPAAGRIVLLFGAMPLTLQLLASGNRYQVGIGLTFVLVAGVILRALSTSHVAFAAALTTRTEMASLIEALQQSEKHYRYSVDLNPQIPWISDPTGALTELSPRWAALTGKTIEESLGEGWVACVHPDDLPGVLELWHEALSTGRGDVADTRYRLRHADGTYRWHRARAWPRLDDAGAIVSWYGSLEDIDDQVVAERALQDSEERYRLASMASNDAIWDISLHDDRITWSGAVGKILGHTEALAATSRQWWLDRVHPEDRAKMGIELAQRDDPGFTHWEQEFRAQAANGEFLNLRARGHVVRDADNRPIRLIGSLQDVTAQKQYEEKLRWAAHYDSLTQLPNRVLFAERLDAALEKARACNEFVGLVVLDVDRFKTINDSLGHDTGDALLREVAARLRRKSPQAATVARLGGDEFAIILPGLESSDANTETIERLLAEVCTPMSYAGRQIEVSLSAGAAAAFSDGDDAEELHKSADLALYAAKADGPGRVRGFERGLRDAAAREEQMLSDARSALNEDRLVPFYQPKICLRTGRLLGFEALLRWRHPERGYLLPGAIGAAFEDPLLSVQITDRMVDQVVSDMRSWRRCGLAFGRIAINGSPEDFRRGDFAERILDRLQDAELPASLLELEVTESVFVGQLAENVSDILNKLSKAGVTIALDDFGTGYASLTHLKQFPVDTLKIDRSFVSKLGVVETGDAAIVGAVIDLARNLGITTVAEGIETQAQAAHLLVKGCDIGQGFLFGRPMGAEKVAKAAAAWDNHSVVALCNSDEWVIEARRGHFQRFG